MTMASAASEWSARTNEVDLRVGLFGDSHIDEIAKTHSVDTVSKLPINNKLAAAVDAGAIELFEGDWLEELANKIEKL